MNTQPTALDYATNLEARGFHAEAAELRRLHALTQGTPATGGEPVGWMNHCGDIELNHKPWMGDVWTPLYASPQPVREPAGWLYDWFSDEGELVCDWFTTNYDEAHSEANQAHNIRALDYRGTSTQSVREPMPRRTLLDMTQCYSDRETFGRAVEAAHGITGGQHGTDA